MPDDRTTALRNDPRRHMHRALAALREAADSLEQATAAGETPSVPVASASSHVAAARALLKPQTFGAPPATGARERDAA